MTDVSQNIVQTYKQYLAYLYPSDDLHRQVFQRYQDIIFQSLRRNYQVRYIPEIISNRPHQIWEYLIGSMFGEAMRLPDIKNSILADFNNLGYIWTYLGFINKEDPRVILYSMRANDYRINNTTQQRIPQVDNTLTTDNFEQATSVISIDDYTLMTNAFSDSNSTSFIKDYQQTKPNRILMSNREEGIFRESRMLDRGGWSTQQVIDAILATGLVDRSRPQILNSALGFRNNITISPRGKFRGALPGFGFVKRETYRGGQIIRYSDDQGIYYMPKYYYEVIYRKLMGTLIYVDWNMCRGKTFNYRSLLWIAHQLGAISGSLPEEDTEQNYNNLCSALATQSGTRRRLLVSSAPTRRYLGDSEIEKRQR